MADALSPQLAAAFMPRSWIIANLAGRDDWQTSPRCAI